MVMNLKKYCFVFLLLPLLSVVKAQDSLFIHLNGQFTIGIPFSQIDSIYFVKPAIQVIEEEMPFLYTNFGKPYGIYPLNNRADDFGYPAFCLFDDLNGPDMVNLVSGYDWFAPSQEYSDRITTYASAYIRWQLFYNQMSGANRILASIPKSTTSTLLNQSRGQALAVRAFDLFNLVQHYQFTFKTHGRDPAVPIEEAYTVDVNNNPRASVEAVYDLILADLSESIQLLDGFSRPDKSQIDQQVAYGLRARVHLVMQHWTQAASDAAMALNGYTPYASNEITAPGFYNASDHNWMWAVLIPASVASEELATWPSQLGSFSGNSYVAYAGIWRSINKLLYDKIPATDVRKNWWLDENKHSSHLDGLTWIDNYNNITYTGQEIVDAVITDVKQSMEPFTNIKFGQRSGIGSNVNDGDWCLMRAEEMILIRAEALAKGGDLQGGKQVLQNFVQNYRDPAFTSSASTVAAFENEVWLQRRIELWGEGFSFVDALRLNKNIVRFHSNETTNVPEVYKFNIAAEDPWLLLRIPKSVIDRNSAITDSLNNNGGTQPISGNGAGLTDGVTD